ncbi:FtsX-like permease family protein [Streptomyces sp. NPDC048001]|uniref:ABC transporter permease n=1 Tax=Streptomyces sp. NPDC048001 TaxID=3365498 RepID=UPI003724A742
MRTWYHSWRATIRIARRDAWRAKGRSLLVLAMIALPILGVSAADLTLRSAELSAEEAAARSMGAADGRLSDTGWGGTPILQSPAGDQYAPAEELDWQTVPEGPVDLASVLPEGATTLRDTVATAKLRTAHGLLQTDIRELKPDDPLAEGLMPLLSGRLPQSPDEVTATSHFLETSGLTVGSTLTARGFDREYTVVGTYELPNDLKADQINALPGALIAPMRKALEADGLPTPSASTTLLAKIPGGFTWNTVQEINTKGVAVASRAVAMDPPADSEVPLYRKGGWTYEESAGARAAALAAVGTVVGLAMLEICLLAGPAFAVGARRSRRQLGLVGANGGDRRHIRAIVLSGGLVIGAAAAVVGTLLGLVLTFALQPLLEDALGKRFGAFDVRPLELLGIALLAVLTGLLAAVVPAVTASRQSVLASLTGRRGVRRSSRVLPAVGLVAVVLGAAIALYGSTMTEQFAVVAGGSALAELGIVALTPALVGLFGRTGRLLPLSPRLALRDAVRNRGRTAPAVAAVLAAVAGTVAVATYAASSDAQDRADYVAELPYGAVSVMAPEAGGREAPGVRETVQRTLPVELRADVDRIAVGKPTCSMWDQTDGCGWYEVVVPEANQCPLFTRDPGRPADEDPALRFSVEERRQLARDWRCTEPEGPGSVTEGGVLVGDQKLLEVLEIDDPAAAKALASGMPVAFDKRPIDRHGRIGIKLITDTEAAEDAAEEDREAPGAIRHLTVHTAAGEPQTYGVKLIVPPAAAEAAALPTLPLGAYYSTDTMPGSEQRQKLDGELDKATTDITLVVEAGYTSKNSIVLLSLAVFAGLITIGAAGIATGLAQADAEADLKTLAAVGAPPRVRRTLSGFQCGVVAAMGVVLGAAAGVLPAIGLRLTERRQQFAWRQEALDRGWGAFGGEPFVPIVMPWGTLAALIVAVPVGAAVLAALVTRSRGALARREAA